MQLTNTVHSCSQHGLVTPCLLSECPANVVLIRFLLRCNDGSHDETIRTVNKARETAHQTSLCSIVQV
jgi:hypothetical protein